MDVPPYRHGQVQVGQRLVAVDGGRSQAREVLEGGARTGGVVTTDLGSDEARNELGFGAERPHTDRSVRTCGVHIGDWGEVDVQSQALHRAASAMGHLTGPGRTAVEFRSMGKL
jgi:hypothetical protein